jgi:ATP-dependent Clp protease ATP-binding subunit ClpA
MNQHHTDRVRMSFVLFDEIEKASDALWNLLLGILDKATLTLGDNRRVDFSRTLIFMTANLGAAEMVSMMTPGLGFAGEGVQRQRAAGVVDDQLNERMTRAGLDAARRKFTPEFMNRLDKVVVFRTLGEQELRRVLDIELTMVQRRVLQSSSGIPFILNITEDAREYLLRSGTDLRYGARHLKRAIERSLVHPISNLMASGQIEGGDLICVSYDPVGNRLGFVKEAAEMPEGTMIELLDSAFGLAPRTMAAMAPPEYAAPATVRIHRRA